MSKNKSEWMEKSLRPTLDRSPERQVFAASDDKLSGYISHQPGNPDILGN